MDFEELQTLPLALLVENVAPFVTGDSVIMNVNVNVGEGGRPTTGVGVTTGIPVDGGLNPEVHGDVETGLGGELEGGLNPGTGPAGSGELDLGTGKIYAIMIAVNNVPEGPAFIPDTKTVPVSEDPNDQPADGVIAVFPAIDPDTGKQAEDVRLVKTSSQTSSLMRL